jgi:hypothetical protein
VAVRSLTRLLTRLYVNLVYAREYAKLVTSLLTDGFASTTVVIGFPAIPLASYNKLTAQLMRRSATYIARSLFQVYMHDVDAARQYTVDRMRCGRWWESIESS